MQEAPAGEQIRDEFERVVSIVEKMTGLKSRWRGGVRIIQPQEQFVSFQRFSARKDWDCGLSVASNLAGDALRWRVFIHEALHSVSVGMNAQNYGTYLGWEEATVEVLQRQMRPEILTRLGVTIAEVTFVSVEASWLYEGYVRALRQIAAEFIALPEMDFLKTLLSVTLRERKAYVFAWGKRTASDFKAFKRVYAVASGLLNH